MLAMPWNLTEMHGWGLLGVHTTLYLLDRGQPPLLLEKPLLNTMRPAVRARIEALVPAYQAVAETLRTYGDQPVEVQGVTMLHGLGNRMDDPRESWRGRRNVGVIAFEDTFFPAEAVERGRRYDCIVTHSRFNVQMLRDAGMPDVRLAWQGVEPEEIAARPPRRGVYGDRFVIFSGGKLEYRKGQDIVLEAFRRFRQRHPEALLVTAWQNAWPETARSMHLSPWCKVPPEIPAEGLTINTTAWAQANGVPPEAFVDLGFLDRGQVMAALAEADAAVFPNRCEGATNLVANEAMAAGIPVVLAANTGQLDLMMQPDTCYPLLSQTPVHSTNPSLRGWADSDPEELVEQLEAVYTDREEARQRAEQASHWILANRTWRLFAEAFVTECERP